MLGTAHDLSRHSRAHAFALAVALAALIALALPALAGAASGYEVEGTGDGVKSVPGDECETAAGECTFRAAIEAANEEPDKDRIFFNSSVFHGDTGATLVLGSALPPITQPLRIDATPCEVGQGPPFPCVPIVAPAGSVGIDVTAGDTAVEGLMISGARTGIRLSGGSAGNKVEGNEILTPSADSNSIAILILNGPNQVYANEIEGSCCLSGIFLQGNANGNRIGGDTAQSENVIDGFQNGAIAMTLPETSRNEVGRNRGDGGASFIGLFRANGLEPNLPNQIDPPAIGSALQSSVSGTAKPGAKVRVFRKATGDSGEIEGFLDDAVADGSGNWRATFPAIPVGTFVAATQTLGGGTSELTEAATSAADPPPNGGDGNGGAGGGGNNGSGGGTSGSTGSAGGSGGPAGPPAPVAPRVRIAAGPAGTITATTAKFRFSSPEAGSSFECRLDGGKFARCRSPRTYRNLKPGRHVFRVRAVDPSGPFGAAVKRAFVVS